MLLKNYVNITGQHLTEYSFTTGGGMSGQYYSETVKRYDDSLASIITEEAAWHGEAPVKKEYLVDIAILEDLEATVRDNKMNYWNRKTFTKMFVDDGESDSYRFSFDDTFIYFSSQIYPDEYKTKLAELSDIVKKYLQNPKSEEIDVVVTNELVNADIWIIPDTEKNRKASVWGSATLPEFEVMGSKEARILKINGSDDMYLIRMIDEEKMLYSVDGITLVKGQKIIIRKGSADMTAVVEVYAEDGTKINEFDMFVAKL